jgi:uncharacterized protein (DUF1778 family)
MSTTSPRTEKVDLRLTQAAKHILQTAARANRRSVSEFVLESALARAEETLPDRQRFDLDETQWAAFQAALDAPVYPTPHMTSLLSQPGPFDAAISE